MTLYYNGRCHTKKKISNLEHGNEKCQKTGGLFIMAKRWEQPKCRSTHKWVSKIHTAECYLALKRKEILTHATWMKLEDITGQ
jgi:hypothetical protein